MGPCARKEHAFFSVALIIPARHSFAAASRAGGRLEQSERQELLLSNLDQIPLPSTASDRTDSAPSSSAITSDWVLSSSNAVARESLAVLLKETRTISSTIFAFDFPLRITTLWMKMGLCSAPSPHRIQEIAFPSGLRHGRLLWMSHGILQMTLIFPLMDHPVRRGDARMIT